ncbi:hypothetical protein GJAV_G00191340 [Gymnothorax javanicus]|nr:hypothetical protein GJAV_G00191340 [Gymnothorax javanicus]
MDIDTVNMLLIAGVTLAVPILAFAASYFLWPSILIKIYNWYWRRTLGLQVRYADCGGYRFCYSSRGKPGLRPSILMLHGFSSNKDGWLSLVKFLPKHLHLLCLDIPGHGGTTRTSTDDYSVPGQVRRIHQFVESVRLNKKPFHLMGSSLGGSLAGVYAAFYPEHIFGLTLVCPGGLRAPIQSRFEEHLLVLQKAGVSTTCPLIPTTPQEMEDMMQLCSHVRFRIPQQILQGMVDVRLPHNGFYRECFKKVIEEESRYCLHDHMHKITAPVQVIWGKQDEVVDVSGTTVIAEVVPGCQVELLDNCGHSVVKERPKKTAKLIMDFIIAQQGLDSTTSKKLS